MIQFADSVSPELIPSSFSHVAAYSTGRYAWPAAELDRFPRRFKIGVLPGSPDQAHAARGLDIERFDARPADFLPFARLRHQLGHRDATAYCSLSMVPELLDVMFGVDLPWVLWAAWYVPSQPSAAKVLGELAGGFGVKLPASKLWAVQYDNGRDYDTSVLYGTDDFTRRS